MKRLYTRTRFETEVKSNSQMAYWFHRYTKKAFLRLVMTFTKFADHPMLSNCKQEAYASLCLLLFLLK